MMKKKDKTCLKYITLKLLGNFLGEINFYVTKLLKKSGKEVINKIDEDFEKIVAMTKELKLYAKNILPNYKK